MFTTQFKLLVLFLIVVGLFAVIGVSIMVLTKRVDVLSDRLDREVMVKSVTPVAVATPTVTATPSAKPKFIPAVKVASPTAAVK